MPSLAVVLYEDQRGPRAGFGPHELVLACVSDRIGVSRRPLREHVFPGFPKKGNAKLLAACRDDAADLADRHRHVVAVFDDDAVRSLVGLPSGARRRDVATAVLRRSGAPRAMTVLLLGRRMEDVVSAAQEAMGETHPAAKRIGERDDVLGRAVAADVRVRERILERVPAVRCLVDLLVRLWRQHVGAAQSR